MSPRRLPSWPAQTPSIDFADRTAFAMLKGRGAPRRRTSLRYGVAIGAAATALVAGGAWAWTTLPKAPVRTPTVTIELPAHVASPPEARREPERPPVEIAPVAPPHVATPMPHKREIAARPPAAAIDAGRPLILPRCNCQEAICDCLEQH